MSHQINQQSSNNNGTIIGKNTNNYIYINEKVNRQERQNVVLSMIDNKIAMELYAEKHFHTHSIEILTDEQFEILWDYFLCWQSSQLQTPPIKHVCDYCRTAEISEEEYYSQAPYCPIHREEKGNEELNKLNKQYNAKKLSAQQNGLMVGILCFLAIFNWSVNLPLSFVASVVIGFSVWFFFDNKNCDNYYAYRDRILKKYNLTIQ